MTDKVLIYVLTRSTDGSKCTDEIPGLIFTCGGGVNKTTSLFLGNSCSPGGLSDHGQFPATVRLDRSPMREILLSQNIFAPSLLGDYDVHSPAQGGDDLGSLLPELMEAQSFGIRYFTEDSVEELFFPVSGLRDLPDDVQLLCNF